MKQSEVDVSLEHLQGTGSFLPGKRQLVLSLLLFAVIPAIFLFVALQLTKVSGPQWLGSNFENSYTYLFNALLIVKGDHPAHIDHPGTTTQLFGAAVLEASGKGSGEKLIRAVLENPEKFLKRMHRALLIASALALWILPWLTALRTASYITALLLQIPSLFFNSLLYYSIWFGSDLALVIFSVGATSLCVLLMSERERDKQNWFTVVLAGATCGLGAVTKLTFFPLILITFVCCRGVRNHLLFVAAFSVFVAVALVPIYPELSRVFYWIAGLATHSGYYGKGEVGFARVDQYLPDILRLLSEEPSVILIPALTTSAIIVLSFARRTYSTRSTGKGLLRTSIVLSALQMVSFLIIAKHARHHYLIPLCLSTSLNLVVLYEALRRMERPFIVRVLGAMALLSLVVYGSSNLVLRTPKTYLHLRSARLDQLRLYSRVKGETGEDTRVDYYRAISPEFAMYFGNAFARRAFTPWLEKKYPRALFFNIFNGKFDTFRRFLEPSSIFPKYDRLYFFGNAGSMNGEGNIQYFDSKSLQEVDRQGSYVLQRWIRK
jgi:hypothetical protein